MSMKLQFVTQDFQTAAVRAVTDLFAGQEHTRATFSVMDEGQLTGQSAFGPAELGVGNVLRLDGGALTDNMSTSNVHTAAPRRSCGPQQWCVNTLRPASWFMSAPTILPAMLMCPPTGTAAFPWGRWRISPCGAGGGRLTLP